MNTIPTEADWEDYSDHLDIKYAHDMFIGKTNEQMLSEYKDRVLSRSEDIFWMPKRPFQYYICGFRDFVMRQDFGLCESADAASSFLNLIVHKLENQPDFILPILQQLLPDIEFIANNQELFEADEEIYGNFQDTLARINGLIGKIRLTHR
jgi:hypothetical protein